MQAQTAECLVVGEIATDKLLVVLNKVDLLPQHNRDKVIAKAQKMLLQTFAHTKFRRPPMVAVSAKPGKVFLQLRMGGVAVDSHDKLRYTYPPL